MSSSRYSIHAIVSALSEMSGMTAVVHLPGSVVIFFQDYDEVFRLSHMKVVCSSAQTIASECRKKQESYFSKWTRLTEVKE